MSAKQFEVSVLDMDGHVYEPPAIWDSYVPENYRAEARGALFHAVDDDGNRVTIVNGTQAPSLNRSKLVRQAIWRPGMTPAEIGRLDPSVFVPLNPGASDAGARLADMDEMGVDQAVLFPTIFAEYLPIVENPDAADVLAHAYNDWIYELSQAAPDRLYPVGILPLQSLYFARRELARLAEQGFKSVLMRPMFYAVPPDDRRGPTDAGGFVWKNPRGVFITDDHFAPLWHDIESAGMVASVHPSLGITNPEPTSEGSFVERVAEKLGIGHTVAEPVAYSMDNGIFLTSVCFKGLMEDQPNLRFALLHGGGSSLPLILEKSETYLWLRMGEVAKDPAESVSLEPEHVFERHPALVGFDSWETSIGALVDELLPNVGWGSRYPNHDASEPAEAIANLKNANVASADLSRLMGDNGRQLYNIPALAAV